MILVHAAPRAAELWSARCLHSVWWRNTSANVGAIILDAEEEILETDADNSVYADNFFSSTACWAAFITAALASLFRDTLVSWPVQRLAHVRPTWIYL